MKHVVQESSIEVESSTETTVSVEQHQSTGAVERTSESSVNLFIGLPGAGKTEACRITEDLIGWEDSVDSYEVSTFVRNEYQVEVCDAVSDNELGRWAAQKKAEYGDDYFVRTMAEELAEYDDAPDHINIAGVRSPEEADAIRDVFGDVTIITIWTLPDIRYERLEAREDNYTHEEFNERKERELWDWGCIEFFTNEDYYDYIVPNNFELEDFRSNLELVLRGTEAYTEQPFPDGLTQEHVAQYL